MPFFNVKVEEGQPLQKQIGEYRLAKARRDQRPCCRGRWNPDLQSDHIRFDRKMS